MFKDRSEAGALLALKLAHYRNKPAVVVAIPRGGLPIGAEIAKFLNAPLDVALVKKIGHPYNKEFAIGAVSLDHMILDQADGIPEDYMAYEIQNLRRTLTDKYNLYYRTKKPISAEGKIIIVTDDGMATGNTLRATLALLLPEKPKGIVIALPVAPAGSLDPFRQMPEILEVICLENPPVFNAVGAHYEDFLPVSDAEAVAIFEGH